MIRKILPLLLGVTISLFAKVQNIELLADNVNRFGHIVEVKGDVVMYSQDYFVTADRGVYDENNEIIELFGNVNSMRGQNQISKADYVKIDLKNDTQNATKNFMMDKKSELWVQNDESCSDPKYYRVKNSVVSSCNIQNPDWRIKFTSGKLNKQTEFLHLFNPVFYIKDVPVFYLPYFGFPTDDTRRTGLLLPEIGYIKKEGLYYKQPIYFAPYANWDFQLDPQIRTRRGSGIYGTFRFADSAYSYGEIRGGIFDNKKKHQKRLEYKNEHHHGYEVQYDRSRLIKYLIDGDFKENLWIDFKQVNDIEYFDLKEKGRLNENDDSLVTSKLNYYLTTNEHYFGTYMRYYIDTDKLNKKNEFQNDDTVQEIPTLQYHKFTDSALTSNLLYSIDAKYHNYIRKKGVEAKQYEFSLPVSYNLALFNSFLNLSFMENVYATYIDYDSNYIYDEDEDRFKEDKSSHYLNHYHMISLFADVARAYDGFYHTMTFGFDYLIPGIQKGDINSRIFKNYQYEYDKDKKKINKNKLKDIQSNLYYEDNFINELSQDYTQRNISSGFTQYFYDKNGRKFIRHSAKQRYNFKKEEFGVLDHKVDFYFKNGLNIGNKFEYSHEYHSFDKVQTYAKYHNKFMNSSLTHSYEYLKKDKDKNKFSKDNYAKLNLSFNLPQYYKIFGAWEYDLERSYSKMWRLGVTHNRKCWNYSFVYQEDIEPKTSSNSSYEKASKKQGFYFLVNFYPFGGLGYDFSVDHEYEKASL